MQNSEFRIQTASDPTQTGGKRRAKPSSVAKCMLSAFCILHSAFLSGCQKLPPRDPNVIIIVSRLGPNNLHPLKANDEGTARVSQLMFDSLIDIGNDLRPQPRLIERLEMPDPITYVVHLRRGVTFHNGQALTSKDVVSTFSRFLDPEFISPQKGAFTVMTGVPLVTVAWTV